MRHFGLSLSTSCLLFALPLTAQGAEEGSADLPKVKLASMVKEAAGDSDKLFAAAQFAKANQLDRKASEIFAKILGKSPDHKAANEALGHQMKDGKWRAEVEGIWVELAHKAEAMDGIFHHAGARVNAFEKKKLLEGYVRHKWTNLLIPAADAEKSNADQFPLGDDKWGSVADADKVHADRSKPWIIRTSHCYVVTTLPYNTIRSQIWGTADSVFGKLQTICGGKEPHPNRMPIVWVMPSTAMYVEFGDAYGGGESSHGAFHTTADQFTMKIAGTRRPVAAANWGAQGWGPYYVRHAAALAIVDSYLGKAATRTPAWFRRGLAGYSSRLFSPQIAAFFGKQHKKAGCPDDLGKFFEKFQISGDNPNSGQGTNDHNIFHAGLIVKFCMEGGDKEATDALMGVTAAIQAEKGIPEAVGKLREALSGKAEAVNSFLDKITG